MVVASALADRLIGVGAGVSFAVVAFADSFWRARSRFRHRHVALVNAWRAVPRRSRRAIRQAMRTGKAVPTEYAAFVIEQIDAAREIRREDTINMGRRVLRSFAPVLATVAVGALLLSTGPRDRVELVLGFACVSAAISFAVVILAALIRNVFWERRWPPRLDVARAAAERILQAPDSCS
jgi:hypothetical protein